MDSSQHNSGQVRRYSLLELKAMNRQDFPLPPKVHEDLSVIFRDCQEMKAQQSQPLDDSMHMMYGRAPYGRSMNSRGFYNDPSFPAQQRAFHHPQQQQPQQQQQYSQSQVPFGYGRRSLPMRGFNSPPGMNDPSGPLFQQQQQQHGMYHHSQVHNQPHRSMNVPHHNIAPVNPMPHPHDDNDESEWNQVGARPHPRRVSDHSHEMDRISEQFKAQRIRKESTDSGDFVSPHRTFHHSTYGNPPTQPYFQPHFSSFSAPSNAAHMWFYQDFSGRDQGPFTNHQMTTWFRGGYFQPVLPIRRADQQEYHPLHWLVTQNGGVPPFDVKFDVMSGTSHPHPHPQHHQQQQQQQPYPPMQQSDTLILGMQQLDQHIEQEVIKKQEMAKAAEEQRRMLIEGKKRLEEEKRLLEEERKKMELERKRMQEEDEERERLKKKQEEERQLEAEKRRKEEIERLQREKEAQEVEKKKLQQKLEAERLAQQEKQMRHAPEAPRLDENRKQDPPKKAATDNKSLADIIREEAIEAEKQKQLRQQLKEQQAKEQAVRTAQQEARAANPWHQPEKLPALSLAELERTKKQQRDSEEILHKTSNDVKVETHKKPIKMMENSLQAIRSVKVEEKTAAEAAAWKGPQTTSSFWEILQEQKQPVATATNPASATDVSHRGMTMASMLSQHVPSSSWSTVSNGAVKTVVAPHLLQQQQQQQQQSSIYSTMQPVKNVGRGVVGSAPLSPEEAFRQWCEQELSHVQNIDVTAFLDFLMNLEVDVEIHDYVREYLKGMAPDYFANDFIRRRHLLRQQKKNTSKSMLTAALVAPPKLSSVAASKPDEDYQTVTGRRQKKK